MTIKRLIIDCVTLILAFSLGVGTGILACSCYATIGRNDVVARLSTLSNVRTLLVAYAEANGRYPDRIEDAIQSKSLLNRLEAHRIDYRVAGRKYPLDSGEFLFEESSPGRYGFIEGRFQFYETRFCFMLDYSGKRKTPVHE